MSPYSNSELRELLANPQMYTAEAVHQAAKELSSRNGVPRYYTRIHSPLTDKPIKVNRTYDMDLHTKILTLFSEANLKLYALLLASMDGTRLLWSVWALMRFIKLSPEGWVSNNLGAVYDRAFPVAHSLFGLLFFLTLFNVLSRRTVRQR